MKRTNRADDRRNTRGGLGSSYKDKAFLTVSVSHLQRFFRLNQSGDCGIRRRCREETRDREVVWVLNLQSEMYRPYRYLLLWVTLNFLISHRTFRGLVVSARD